MSTPVSMVSQQIIKGSDSHGFGWKPVKVVHVILNGNIRMATVVDDFGKSMQIRCDIMHAKGNLPEPGEQWLVHRQYGIWMFGAIINGTTRGVEVTNVTDLPETLAANAAAAAAATNAVQAATTGKVAAKGDLLAGTTAGVVVNQPAGATNTVLTPDPTTSSGLSYKQPLALVTPLPGATAGGRFVGTTATGPPTSGSFSTGDYVNTRDGNTWLCTAGGTPGTWTQSAPGPLTVDGSKLVQNLGNPILASAAVGSGVQLNAGLVLSVDGTGTNFVQHRADSFMVMSANNAVIGGNTGNAAFLSNVDAAGIKLAAGTMLVTDGSGTLFGTAKAQTIVVAGGNNATLGGIGGNAAFVSPAVSDNAGIKLSSNLLLVVNGNGTLFQKLKAYDLTISSANNAFIGLIGANAAFVSGTVGDNSGIKFASSILLITDGTGNVFGPGKCTVMTQTSSGKLKEQVRRLRPHERGHDTFTEIVKGVHAKRFKFKHEVKSRSGPNGEPHEDHIGFIAEELAAAHPDLVLGDLNDPMSVAIAPTSLIAVLWEMNKELVERIERLEGGPVTRSRSDPKE